MGFSKSGLDAIEYNRSLQHKKSYFKSRDVSQISRNLEAGDKRRQLSKEALKRIKQSHKDNNLRSMILLIISTIMTALVIWILFF